MNGLLRKLRGLVGVGLTWGLGYAALMGFLWAVIGIADPDTIGPDEGLLRVSAIIGGVGFLSGLVFGALMSLAETRKTILELSLTRVAVWGMAGAAAFPLLTGRASQLIWTVPLGAIFSAGSVALARRAELRNPASPLLTDDTVSAYTQAASSKELHR